MTFDEAKIYCSGFTNSRLAHADTEIEFKTIIELISVDNTWIGITKRPDCGGGRECMMWMDNQQDFALTHFAFPNIEVTHWGFNEEPCIKIRSSKVG